jgi:hypothetical protein
MSVYIFEQINIIGSGRGKFINSVRDYMAPHLENRYGVRLAGLWVTIGSTGAWPEADLMWEMDDWNQFGGVSDRQYPIEDRDPYLNEIWRQELAWRSGGKSSLLAPTPFSPSLAEFNAAGPAHVFVYENVQTLPGKMAEYHAAMRSEYLPRAAEHGIRLMGAYEHAIRPNVGVNLWAFRDLDHWGRAMEDHYTQPAIQAWYRRCRDLLENLEGWTLINAPQRTIGT